MAESGESPRLSDELGPVDYLMHRGEANPRTRSGIMALELLDGTPDWDRFRTRFENASRRVLRLRQKVVVPTLPTAAPRWVVDPDFNLDFHVRRVRVSGPATLREVLDLAEVILQSPLDISRPLWTATLVEGMADGRAAMLLHVSHAVTDGVGGVEMFAQIYDLERDPPPRSTPPQPIPEDLSPNDLMRRGINHLPIAVVGGVLDALSARCRVDSRGRRARTGCRRSGPHSGDGVRECAVGSAARCAGQPLTVRRSDATLGHGNPGRKRPRAPRAGFDPPAAPPSWCQTGRSSVVICGTARGR